jgi:phospholipid-transporting ATPase
VNFEDPIFWDHLGTPQHQNNSNIERALTHLALCHTIILDERTGKYNASSPDELALVNAAKFFGAVFNKRDEDNILTITYQGQPRSYRLLNILEFTSTRKRMSVIVEDLTTEDAYGERDIYVLTKGADSIITPRLSQMRGCQYLPETERFVKRYAEEGLRTLLLAQKMVTRNEYVQWNAEFEAAMQSVSNREEEVAKVCDMMERGLELVGSTAIEDKLQEGVNQTIQYMRSAGIKVWVLTGDKIETAINIGYSSGLLDQGMA